MPYKTLQILRLLWLEGTLGGLQISLWFKEGEGQIKDEDRLLRTFDTWVLKAFKDGGCTTPLGSIWLFSW